ncbi:MAG: tetratricopeptide repeat protein [Chitinophagaceae bacterium]|nr:MAG: tetratricopeptide repeat protein [Chitinophagaceae bacterium]
MSNFFPSFLGHVPTGCSVRFCSSQKSPHRAGHPLCMFVTAFICLLLSNVVYAQHATGRNLYNFFDTAHRLGQFNGNALVVEKGRVVSRVSMGKADTSGSTNLTADYRFHIGSIAKEFNAVAIMMLADQHKLSLDDKLSRYLPDLPSWSNEVSIRNLLQYTSGVPDVKWKTVHNDEENWNDLLKLDSLAFKPGTAYNYNNNNTYLQRRVVAAVSGMSFKDFVVKKMLEPIGIVNAVIDPTEKDRQVARAFSNAGSQDPLAVPISGWTALTIDDLLKWTLAIRDFKLITPAATAEIITGFRPGDQSGLGGGSMENKKIVRHVHDGTARNYQALLADYPLKGRSILLMTNNQQNNLYAIEKSISNYLDGGPLVPIRKSLLRDLSASLDTLGAAGLLEVYRGLKKSSAKLYSFDSETTLNEIGYAYLGKNKRADAIILFEYNTKLFPSSGNVFDSLAEAYYADGNKAKALENYKKALELDPTNETAKRIVEELK